MVEGRGDILKSSCPPFLFDDSELSFCSHFSAELSAWAPMEMGPVPGSTEKVGCCTI